MNYLDYIVIVVYLIGFLFLGRLFKDSKSGDDYFLGGKTFHWFPLSLSTAATQISAISFISAPAFVGLKKGGGMMWLTYEFGVPLAMLFLMVYLIPPMFKANIVSVYEYLEKRYGASTRVLLSIVFQISRALATGIMVYAVSLILESVLNVPLWASVLIIGVITLIYSYQGGMKAVVYGDMIQLLILFFGILICLGAGLYYLGGWDSFIANVDKTRTHAVDFNFGIHGEVFGFWPMLIGGFFLYSSYYGTDQSQVQRLFSAKNNETVSKTLLCNGLMRFPITLTYCVMGLIIGTLVSVSPEFKELIPVDKPDMMIPIFIRDYLPNGIIGILVVAIFSAAMSSLSSTINSLSATTVEDLFNRKKDLPLDKYMRYSKISAIFWGVTCIVLAFFTGEIAETVIEAINKIGSVFYGPIFATFICAILLKQTNVKGANAGLIAGVFMNIILWLFFKNIFWFWWNFIGCVVTIIISLVISSLFRTSINNNGKTADKTLEFNFKSADLFGFKPISLILFFVFIVLLSIFIPYLF